jgi:predicted regulator of Ras-like GTPase activity (Roadblock/LC7/MglB family)
VPRSTDTWSWVTRQIAEEQARMTTIEPAGDPEGFTGDVTGLGLSDVIQLNGHNGFSGCITVQQGSRIGRIFFREGKIIHAEQGGKLGEEAFYDIMEWRSGHFSLERNVSTTSYTIQKNTQFILMEAHRLMDERRAGRATPPPVPPAATPTPTSPALALLDRVKGAGSVSYAVLLAKDGTCVEDSSFAGAALAGRTAYLAMMGSRLGASLGAGETRSVALHGKAQHLLLLASKSHYLGVLADGAAELGAVEADVLKLLGTGH